jgi:hypothetical protein
MTPAMRLRRPSPALVVALVALFAGLGGTGYAALRLPGNSVGARQIRTGGVGTSEVRNHSLRDRDFKAGQLPRGPAGAQGVPGPRGPAGPKGPVGTPGTSVAPAEAVRLVGAPGQPAFLNGWHSVDDDDPTYAAAGFFKDPAGVVHLQGSVKSGTAAEIFVLPPGYRPSGREGFSTPGFGVTASVDVSADGTVRQNSGTAAFLALSGITFRAAP